MTSRQIATTSTVLFVILTAVFVGLGSNVWIGWGVFFGLSAISGILGLENDT